jgi:hypothetical protein
VKQVNVADPSPHNAESRGPAARAHGEGDGSLAATQPLGGLPAHRGGPDRSVQAGRALVRANGATQTEARATVRGGTRRHGKGWGWFFSAPDPATGKRRRIWRIEQAMDSATASLWRSGDDDAPGPKLHTRCVGQCSPGLFHAFELGGCRRVVSSRTPSSRGVTAGPVSNHVSIGAPVPSGRGRLRRSGPPRPGTDRPAGHGKADASAERNSELLGEFV